MRNARGRERVKSVVAWVLCAALFLAEVHAVGMMIRGGGGLWLVPFGLGKFGSLLLLVLLLGDCVTERERKT